MKTEIKWLTLSNYDDSASLSQHAFLPREGKRKWTEEKFIGNKTACHLKIRAFNEKEEEDIFEALDSEEPTKGRCKLCINALKRLESPPQI